MINTKHINHNIGGNMKKHDTLNDFKNALLNMEHRERFVFNKGEQLDNVNSDIDSVEIYATKLYDKSTFSNGLDTNIKVSFVDVSGKQISGRQYCINKYIRLWSPKFFETVYNFIA